MPPYVTIAAVNGYALGGGLEMALACDFIYASSNAEMGLPEIKLGLIPGFGGTQRLAHAIGKRRAKEMILTGKRMNAQEALDIGLINKVCRSETLIEDCRLVVMDIINHSWTAVLHAKQAINANKTSLKLESSLCALCFATPECQTALKRF